MAPTFLAKTGANEEVGRGAGVGEQQACAGRPGEGSPGLLGVG